MAELPGGLVVMSKSGGSRRPARSRLDTPNPPVKLTNPARDFDAIAERLQVPEGPVGRINKGAVDFVNSLANIVLNPLAETAKYAGVDGLDFRDPLDNVTKGIRPSTPAEGWMEKGLEGTGSALAALVPFLKGAEQVGKAPGLMGEAANAILEAVRRNPKLFPFLEGLSGFGGGATGEVVADEFGEEWRPTGEVVGAIGAGAAPSIVAGAAGLSPTVRATNWLREALLPQTEEGARIKASRFLREQVADPDEVRASITDSEDIGWLSPAQLSGEENLLRLERSLADRDPELARDLENRAMASTGRLRTEMQNPTQGATSEDARASFMSSVRRQEDALNKELEAAEARAAERLKELSPKRRETENSKIVSEELESAYAKAKQQERDLWAKVDPKSTVRMANLITEYNAVKERVSAAQASKIPKVVDDLLRSKEWTANGQNFKEMHGLYSELREISRAARSGETPSAYTAKVAEDLADAILRDIDAAGDMTSEAFAAAREWTRTISSTFKQDTVGRLMARSRTGAERIDEELALGASVGQQGARAKVALDDIRAAVGDSPATEDAVADYLLGRFVKYAAYTGDMEPKAAARFLAENEELLASVPTVKARIEAAVSARASKEEISALVKEGRKILENSPESVFVGSRRGEEFESILGSQEPREAAKRLVQEASADKSGKAVGGLKASAFDWLLSKSRTLTKDGKEITSGRTFLTLLTDSKNRAALSEVFSQEELSRLGQIGQEFLAVERSLSSTPLPGGPVPNAANKAIRYVIGTIAARVGAAFGAGTSGASLRTSAMASNRATEILDSLSSDQAIKLLIDAARDKDLYASLLLDPDKPKEAAKMVSKLGPWLAAQTGLSATDRGEENTGPKLPGGLKIMGQVPVAPPTPEAAAPGRFQFENPMAGLLDQVRTGTVNAGNWGTPPEADPNAPITAPLPLTRGQPMETRPNVGQADTPIPGAIAPAVIEPQRPSSPQDEARNRLRDLLLQGERDGVFQMRDESPSPWEDGSLDGSLQGNEANVKGKEPPVSNTNYVARSPAQLASYFVGLNENDHGDVIGGFIESMTGKSLNPAETAWCAAFVNGVLKASGVDGTGALNARSFLNFGTKATSPEKGDIVVLWRNNPNSPQGHVGFYAGEVTRNGQKYVRVLGGNQGNAVTESLYPAKRVLDVRRPPKLKT